MKPVGQLMNIDDNKDQSDSSVEQQVGSQPAGLPSHVQFAGAPGKKLFVPHATNANISYPDSDHPLVRDQYYYTVPEQLLELVCQRKQGESFTVDNDLLQLDLRLSQICGDHGAIVGFWRCVPVDCDFLYCTKLRRETLAGLGYLSKSEIDKTLRTANEKLCSHAEIACGYSGWLMTNPAFVRELGELTSEYQSQLQNWGIHAVRALMPSSMDAGPFNPTGQTGWCDYESAVTDFCLRWRLFGLAGPRIPISMQPMLSGVVPVSMLDRYMQTGGVFHWPDTFPVYAREELRDLISSALRSSRDAEHLEGWNRIIDSKNKAKNQIRTLARRFRLQHFWRLLRERYPDAFPRRLEQIELAFAGYFGLEERTIRNDRVFLEKTLGKSWGRPAGPSLPRSPR